MSHVSSCCHREIVVGHRKEFPLGGSTWYELYKIDICSCCGNEAEEYVDACEECGEVGCECDNGRLSMVSKEDAKQAE